MAELRPYKGVYYLWQYVPKKAAAVIFLLFFLFSTAAVAYRMYKSKTWYCSVFVIGGFCKCKFILCMGRSAVGLTSFTPKVQVIGYGARAGAHDNTDKLMPFVIQNTFILLSPALFAASIYMILGRIIRRVRAEAHSLIPTRWLTKIFVAGDVLSFTVQGGAAGLMATGDNAAMGEKIVIAGLLIQIIVFGFFMVVTVVFHKRLMHARTLESQEDGGTWATDLYMLYTVSMLIMVRSIFRMAEFAMGHDGYLLRNEWPLYVFDSTLMLIVVVIFFWKYPGYSRTQNVKSHATMLQSFSR